MKQLLILDRQFNVKKLGLVNTSPTIFDTISPQKTTLELLKDESVDIGNIISIKQYETQEFLGIVQDVSIKNKTELYIYPFISAFDCECSMESINGYVYDWIVATMEANFVNIVDNSLKLNLEFRNMMTLQPSLSYIFSDGNLFEALKKIFYITGVYLEFSLKFVNGIATAIYCDVYNTNDYPLITVRYDNPLLGEEKPVIENSMNYGTNKIILKPEEGASGSTYAFYLLEDNTVTTNQGASGRLTPVNQKIARYAEGTSSEELQLIAEKELLGEAYDHNIYFKIIKNDSYQFALYRKVKFITEDRIYVSYCSKIDKTQDNVLGITLGVIRNNLTDKVKELEAQTSSLSSATSTGSGAIIPVLNWGNIGGSINNQADLKNALAGKIPTTEKGAVNGVATLGADGKLTSTQMPAIRVTDVYVVASQAEMLALEADEGDVAKRTDLGKSFMLSSGSPTILSSWIPVTDDFEPLGAVSDHNLSETAHSSLFAEKVNPLSFRKTGNPYDGYTWDNAINKANVLLYKTAPTKYNAMLNPWSGEFGGGSLTYALIGFEERPYVSYYIYSLTFKGSDNRVFILIYNTASDTITVVETTDENFTTEEQTKLAGIEEGAEVNVQSDWNQTTDTADDYIKNKPTIPESVVVVDNLTSTSTTSALSANQGKVLNETKVDKVTGYSLTKNDLTDALKASYDSAVTDKHTHSNKTILDNTTASYTTSEATKLSGIAPGAEVNVQSDWNASSGDALILNKPTTISGYGITDAVSTTGTQTLTNKTLTEPKISTISNTGILTLPTSTGTIALTSQLPTLSSLGVTATAAELNHLDGITATVTELNYTGGVTSAIQTQLNGKANKDASNITASVWKTALSLNNVQNYKIVNGIMAKSGSNPYSINTGLTTIYGFYTQIVNNTTNAFGEIILVHSISGGTVYCSQRNSGTGTIQQCQHYWTAIGV